MSEFIQKRVDYINHWPAEPRFPAELAHQNLCDAFQHKRNRLPFTPAPVWVSVEPDYNRAISHLIDGLDMLPLHPNHAFLFTFSALDLYGKKVYAANTTGALNKVIDSCTQTMEVNQDLKHTVDRLCSTIPVSACLYLYSNFHKPHKGDQVLNRVAFKNGDKKDQSIKTIIDTIYQHFGYDGERYADTVRKAACLYRKIFSNEPSIIVDGVSITSTSVLRLRLLIMGIVYSLRNDSTHGSGMASTKSSQTSLSRYALNHYCFLVTYTLLMFVFISESPNLSEVEKNGKYAALRTAMDRNFDDFQELFGKHIK